MSRAPKILAVASSIDLSFRYGCTPAWWQLWKGMHEEGVDLVLAPYRGRPIESPWWRVAENPTYREGESFAFARDTLARLKGDSHLRRAEDNPEDGVADKLTREVIWRWVTPRWQKHLEQLIERERPDAVVVFTVPMAHLRGIPTALRERFGIPVVFYDGDVPMSLPEFGGMDTGFNWYHDADPSEYDLLISNSEGGLERLLELGARRAEAIHWAADPEFFHPHNVEKELDVLFYGYGDKFRRDWMQQMVGEPSRATAGRRLRSRRPRLPGRHRERTADRRHPVQRVLAHDLRCAHQSLHHPSLACDRLCVVVVPAIRACLGRRRDRLEPVQRDRALVRARLGAARRRQRRSGSRRLPGRCWPIPGRRRRWVAARASASSRSTPTAIAPAVCSHLIGLREEAHVA